MVIEEARPAVEIIRIHKIRAHVLRLIHTFGSVTERALTKAAVNTIIVRRFLVLLLHGITAVAPLLPN
jgi:hypothetical protein